MIAHSVITRTVRRSGQKIWPRLRLPLISDQHGRNRWDRGCTFVSPTSDAPRTQQHSIRLSPRSHCQTPFRHESTRRRRMCEPGTRGLSPLTHEAIFPFLSPCGRGKASSTRWRLFGVSVDHLMHSSPAPRGAAAGTNMGKAKTPRGPEVGLVFPTNPKKGDR
jgi:hypothetical protein